MQERLYELLPERKDPGAGEWWPLKDVVAGFDVHKDTALKHGIVVRPRMEEGYEGDRSVYIWVDDELHRKLPGTCSRQQT